MSRPSHLTRIKQLAARKRKAEGEYLSALRCAHQAGEPYVRIAEAAGVSRQNVRQIIERSAS